MANPHRGGVTLKVGDKQYTLSFSVNAMCELEESLGQPVAHIAAGLNDGASVRMSTVRTIIWAGLLDHHEGVSLRDAGMIATEAGILPVMEKIGEAFQRAFPQEASTEGGNPRKAKAA